MVALAVYDGLVVCTLLVVGLTTRVPTRSELTDLAVELGPAPLRASALLAQARRDPTLATDRDLEAALAQAGRLEAANELVRDEVRSAIADVDASRKRLLVASTTERARLAEELDRTTAGPLRALTERATESGLVVPGLARALAGRGGGRHRSAPARPGAGRGRGRAPTSAGGPARGGAGRWRTRGSTRSSRRRCTRSSPRA